MPPLKREYADERKFERVRFTVADLSRLFDMMKHAVHRDPPGDGTYNYAEITIEHGTTSTKYDSLHEIETDTTLPDVVRQVTMRCRTAVGESTRRLSFRTSFGPHLSASSEDEGWVAGQLQVIGAFVEKKERALSVRSRWSDLLGKLSFPLLLAGLLSLASIVLLLHSSSGRVVVSLLAVVFNTLSLVAQSLSKRLRESIPPFELVIREQLSTSRTSIDWGTVALIGIGIITLIVTVVTAVVQVLSWLYPHSPR